MLNKKLIRIISLLCVVVCFMSLFGCLTEKSNNTIEKNNNATEINNNAVVTYPEDVYAIDDFKCVCSTDDETEFVIENDNARTLYTYITEQQKYAEKIQMDRSEQNCIYLSFQDSEPLLFLNQEPTTEISDTPVVSDRHFYGVFWICENDYMAYTAMPMTSFQIYYKMPEGTYNKITELIKKEF